jgi:hypothetical protein
MKVENLKLIPNNVLDGRKAGTIKKIEDTKFDGKHPNGIYKGYAKDGYFINYPRIGESFSIGTLTTSEVTKIVKKEDDYIIFNTENSVYKLTIL